MLWPITWPPASATSHAPIQKSSCLNSGSSHSGEVWAAIPSGTISAPSTSKAASLMQVVAMWCMTDPAP